MTAIQQVAAIGFLAFGTVIAHAAPFPPYHLSLSSFNGSGSSPRINVAITNTSAYTLGFFLESPAFTRFSVEYQSDMTPLSRWTMLKANLQPSPHVDLPGRPAKTRTSTYSVVILIPPGQRYETYDDLVSFPAPEGFYRITAVRAPKMDELSGSANSLKLVRKFDADVRSNSVIIRRTFNELMEVPQ